MICQTCQDTFRASCDPSGPLKVLGLSSTTGRKRRHHRSFQSLRDAVKDGCYLCKTFFELRRNLFSNYDDDTDAQWRGFFNLGGFTTAEIYWPAEGFEGMSFITLNLVWRPQGPQAFDRTGVTFLLHEAEDPSIGISTLQPQTGRLPAYYRSMYRSSSTFQSSLRQPPPKPGLTMAQTWLKQCISDHECQLHQSSTFMPTRLVDVGPDGTGTEPSSWLIRHSSELPHGEAYLTLSHRWGSAQVLRLTTANFPILTKRMKDSDLPPKFQDAVIVTRKLGYRYIWVDSLCIIQDSQDDWARESATMCKVYMNSTCTLAASRAADGSKHFLYDKAPRVDIPPKIRVKWYICPSGGLFDKFTPSSFIPPIWYIPVPSDMYESAYARSPLTTRAWCFQELILSPRILRFEPDQLFWQCIKHSQCEMFPSKSVRTLSSWAIGQPVFFVNSSFTNARNWVRSPAPPHTETKQEWSMIVATYTEGQLTKASDRLIAIAGIAEAVSISRPALGKYLAGLWEAQLPYNLLWCVAGSENFYGNALRTVRRDREYRAPSWSWASVSGAVKPAWRVGQNIRLLTKVFGVSTASAWNSPYGPVSDGYIDLIGILVPVSKETAVWDPKNKLIDPGSDLSENWQNPHFTFELFDNQQLSEIYYLPISYEFQFDGIMGLILEKNRDQNSSLDPAFSRVGLFFVKQYQFDWLMDKAWESLNVLEASEDSRSCITPPPAPGRKQRIVRIV